MPSPPPTLTVLIFFSEKSGKTIHLLKSGSKQTSGAKVRKVVPLLGTFAQFKDSKKKPAPKEVAQNIVDQVMLAPQPNIPPASKEDLKKRK